MKKLLFIPLFLGLLPFSVLAYSDIPTSTRDVENGPQMMMLLEDRVVGSEQREEMEDLMVKMMQGTLTETEAEQMVNFMNEYPGPYSMMMGRLSDEQKLSNTSRFGYGMMMHDGYGWEGEALGGLFGFIVGLCTLVWLIVGLLLIRWLWNKGK